MDIYAFLGWGGFWMLVISGLAYALDTAISPIVKQKTELIIEAIYTFSLMGGVVLLIASFISYIVHSTTC